jgi:hypothetical protein
VTPRRERLREQMDEAQPRFVAWKLNSMSCRRGIPMVGIYHNLSYSAEQAGRRQQLKKYMCCRGDRRAAASWIANRTRKAAVRNAGR